MIASANLFATRPMMLRLSTAAEIMTPNPLSFKQGDSLQKVAALLSFHEFDAAPVTDDAGRLVGLISAEACAAWEALLLAAKNVVATSMSSIRAE